MTAEAYPAWAGRPRPGQDVLELKRELEEEARELARRGVCGCGCGTALGAKRDVDGAILPDPISRTGRAIYVDVRHRQRFRRRLLRRLAEASGIPTNLSVKTIEAANPTPERNGDAQRARKRPRRAPRPGVSIYLPTLDVAEALESLLERRAHEANAELDVALEAIAKALERRRARARRPAA